MVHHPLLPAFLFRWAGPQHGVALLMKRMEGKFHLSSCWRRSFQTFLNPILSTPPKTNSYYLNNIGNYLVIAIVRQIFWLYPFKAKLIGKVLLHLSITIMSSWLGEGGKIFYGTCPRVSAIRTVRLYHNIYLNRVRVLVNHDWATGSWLGDKIFHETLST